MTEDLTQQYKRKGHNTGFDVLQNRLSLKSSLEYNFNPPNLADRNVLVHSQITSHTIHIHTRPLKECMPLSDNDFCFWLNSLKLREELRETPREAKTRSGERESPGKQKYTTLPRSYGMQVSYCQSFHEQRLAYWHTKIMFVINNKHHHITSSHQSFVRCSESLHFGFENLRSANTIQQNGAQSQLSVCSICCMTDSQVLKLFKAL